MKQTIIAILLANLLVLSSLQAKRPRSSAQLDIPLGGLGGFYPRGLVGPLSSMAGDEVPALRLTLAQLLDSAFHNSISLCNTRRSVDVAQEQRREAYTHYFPTVSGTALWFNANRGMAHTTLNPSEIIPSSLTSMLANMLPQEALAALASPASISMMKNGTIAAITAVQPVFAGGQIVNGNKLAKVGEEAARLQVELSENEVEKNVAQYYWQLVAMKEKMNTINAVQEMLADIRKDVETAVKAGVAMRNDLLQVQLRQNEMESQQVKLNNGMQVVRLLLAQYCGIGQEFDVAVPDKKVTTLPAAPQQGAAMMQEVSRLPEYQLLQKQVEAADLQRKMAAGKNLPQVALGAGYNYHNLLDNDRTFAMVFATVSVPISDWWGGSHAVKRKKMELQNAVDQQRDGEQKLAIRLQNAWNSVGESHQQLIIAQQAIEQAEENLRLNRDYMRAGTIKMSDLLEAQLLYQQALDRHTDAFADYQNRLLDYKQAAGIR